MAHATATPTTNAFRAISVEMPLQALKVTPAPTPLPAKEEAIQGKRHRAATLKPIDQEAAHASLLAKRQQWASLNLRQEWADTEFMRGHLKVAGVKVGANTEPATVQRMKAKLRAVGVHSPDAYSGERDRRFRCIVTGRAA